MDNAFFTVFLAIPSRRAIAAIGNRSPRRNRRISAQSSTLITLHRVTAGGQISPVVSDQSSAVGDSAGQDSKHEVGSPQEHVLGR